MNLNQNKGGQVNMTIHPDMIRNSKTFVCECGGVFFKNSIFFKELSPLISPSGKSELAPMQVFVCEKCGKVPAAMDVLNMVPEELKAKPVKEILKESII